MNERINELLKQSRTEYWTQYTPSYDYEKFAELIVKESMAMCDELKAQYLTSRKSTMEFDEKQIYAEGEAACDIIKYKMKKQFGVE
jgi:hypothetical protein